MRDIPRLKRSKRKISNFFLDDLPDEVFGRDLDIDSHSVRDEGRSAEDLTGKVFVVRVAANASSKYRGRGAGGLHRNCGY